MSDALNDMRKDNIYDAEKNALIVGKIEQLAPEDMFIHDNELDNELAVLTADDVQTAVCEWALPMFKPGLLQVMLKLQGEHQELQDAVIHYRNGEGASVVTADDIADECADVMFMLVQIAELVGFDLNAVTMEKLARNKARDWQLQPDGTYQHRGTE